MRNTSYYADVDYIRDPLYSSVPTEIYQQNFISPKTIDRHLFETPTYLLRNSTRRERLKSALYLRLKVREVFEIVKGDHLGSLKIQFVAKYLNRRGTLWRHNLKGETIWAFRNYSLLQNIEKLEGGPFGDKKFEKKSHSAEKNSKGGPYSFVRFCI